jgi:Zn ribbon nucleic-acid-binding protein
MDSPDAADATCPLCAGPAVLAWRSDENLWLVDCSRCRRFTVEAHLMEILRDTRVRTDARISDLLPLLSAAAVHTWSDGGRLNLTSENWRAVAHDVTEQKPLNHRGT